MAVGGLMVATLEGPHHGFSPKASLMSLYEQGLAGK
jgi:hypothetical protein